MPVGILTQRTEYLGMLVRPSQHVHRRTYEGRSEWFDHILARHDAGLALPVFVDRESVVAIDRYAERQESRKAQQHEEPADRFSRSTRRLPLRSLVHERQLDLHSARLLDQRWIYHGIALRCHIGHLLPGKIFRHLAVRRGTAERRWRIKALCLLPLHSRLLLH